MDSAGTSSKCATCPGTRVEFEVLSASFFFPDYTEEFPLLPITLPSSAKVPRDTIDVVI